MLIGILDESEHETNVAKECRIIPQELVANRHNELTSTWYKDQIIMKYWTEKGITVPGQLGMLAPPCLLRAAGQTGFRKAPEPVLLPKATCQKASILIYRPIDTPH